MDRHIEMHNKVIPTYNIPKEFRLSGWVYVLSNPAMPGIFKIGMTTSDPETRAKEISQGTGVPLPFSVVRAYYSNNPREDEQTMHEYLAPTRVNDSREFFSANINEIELAATECGLHERNEPIEQIAEGFSVICFNRRNTLNIGNLLDELGIDVFGCKAAAAEAMIRIAARLISQQSINGNAVIFHGNKARLLKTYTQQNYEAHLTEQAKIQATTGIYGPKKPGGY